MLKKAGLNLLGETGYFSKSSKDSKSLEDFFLISLRVYSQVLSFYTGCTILNHGLNGFLDSADESSLCCNLTTSRIQINLRHLSNPYNLRFKAEKSLIENRLTQSSLKPTPLTGANSSQFTPSKIGT